MLHLLLHTEIRSILEGACSPASHPDLDLNVLRFRWAHMSVRWSSVWRPSCISAACQRSSRRTDVTDVTRKRRGDREDPRFDPPVGPVYRKVGSCFWINSQESSSDGPVGLGSLLQEMLLSCFSKHPDIGRL